MRRSTALVSVFAALTVVLGCAPTTPPPIVRAPVWLVSLTSVDPTIPLDIRYAGPDNFVGAPIDGYEGPVCLLTQPAARAVRAAQEELRALGLSLVVFDCYRPQRAVDHFLRWVLDPDESTRARHYPFIPKAELVSRGYIADRSSHSRGSSLDVSLLSTSWDTPRPLDMGTPFDFFDERSHTDSREVPAAAAANRRLLREVLERQGFRNYPLEWWHFTLRDEPLPDRYLDIPVR
jgi:D-alanyl-D-alanine dipeptidase